MGLLPVNDRNDGIGPRPNAYEFMDHRSLGSGCGSAGAATPLNARVWSRGGGMIGEGFAVGAVVRSISGWLKQGSRALSVVAVLLAGLVPSIAVATDSGAIAYGEGVLGPQKHETGLTSLGPDLFGEEVNTNTGGISFSQTDLSLPGNNALPVNVTRRLIVDGNKSPSFSTDVNLWRGYSFGEWELDLPYMTGIYTELNGWDVSTTTPNARCSSPTNHGQV